MKRVHIKRPLIWLLQRENLLCNEINCKKFIPTPPLALAADIKSLFLIRDEIHFKKVLKSKLKAERE